MIGQNINLEHLVPLALEVLTDDPIASGMCYSGDLLENVLICDVNYWTMNHEQIPPLHAIAEQAIVTLTASGDDDLVRTLRSSYDKFKDRTASFV